MGVEKRLPDWMIAFVISLADLLGNAWIRPAANEATSGLDKDVPLAVLKEPVAEITAVPEPNATTSGFSRWSAVGPIELNELLLPSDVIEPTANTPSASAGVVTNFQKLLFPSLPALQTTTMPFSTALRAVILTTAFLPVKSKTV